MAVGLATRAALKRSRGGKFSLAGGALSAHFISLTEIIAMAEQEFDPIKIKITTTLDRRFAQFYFASDNSPQEPDGSIPIRGQVSFGVRRQPAQQGRAYIIGVRSAFLEIQLSGCRFEENPKHEEKVQDGSFKEHALSERETGHDINAGAEASIKAELSSLKGGVGAKADAKMRHKGTRSEKGERQFECYRLRWEAGGWRFGDMTRGDFYEPDGILRGAFLRDGDWGRLIPDRDTTKYAARMLLLVQDGMLSVTPEATHWTEIVSDQDEAPEADAFNALKAAVAGWVVENELSSVSHPQGFDCERRELVLARGDVTVDLSDLKARTEPPKKLALKEKASARKPRKTPSKAQRDE